MSSRRGALDDAYLVLGIEADAADVDVIKAYRRLISQHHPDKLAAKGLSEEMMIRTTERTRQVKAAYQRIKDARDL